MNVDIGVWASFGAGILSFLSPCILPLVPPYLCFLAGTTLDDLTGKSGAVSTAQVMIRAAAFTLGFSLRVRGARRQRLDPGPARVRASDAAVADRRRGDRAARPAHARRVPPAVSDARGQARAQRRSRSARSAPSWSGWHSASAGRPASARCSTSILLLATTTDTVGRGAVLLAAYSAGIAVPFLAAALFTGPFLRLTARFRRHLGAGREDHGRRAGRHRAADLCRRHADHRRLAAGIRADPRPDRMTQPKRNDSSRSNERCSIRSRCSRAPSRARDRVRHLAQARAACRRTGGGTPARGAAPRSPRGRTDRARRSCRPSAARFCRRSIASARSGAFDAIAVEPLIGRRDLGNAVGEQADAVRLAPGVERPGRLLQQPARALDIAAVGGLQAVGHAAPRSAPAPPQAPHRPPSRGDSLRRSAVQRSRRRSISTAPRSPFCVRR